ncbi:MAG: hypothetical protein K5872_00280 [Rhizobiaceae bacterium]|nr:hypothetical protein [Rhizobiaceae bacterium]MCV0404643.1 hypothetical protein [Rhizobiaceae bacterium]
MLSRRVTLAVGVLLTLPASAIADCAIEHATYHDRDDVAELRFLPVDGQSFVANGFELKVGSNPPFEGFVLWTENPLRPHARVTYQCPEGDVTGDEIEACTIWHGPIYAVDQTGGLDVLPREGAPAPAGLLLADLGFRMVGAAAFDELPLEQVPWDGFRLVGCRP